MDQGRQLGTGPNVKHGELIGKKLADKRLARQEARLDDVVPAVRSPNGPRCNNEVLPRGRWDFPAASTGDCNFPPGVTC